MGSMKKNSNVILIQRLFDEQANENDTSRYGEFFSHDVMIHGPASGQESQGIKEAEQLDVSYIRAYPKHKFTIEEIFALKDKVYVRWFCYGRHLGPYKGIQPKKMEFAIAGFSIYRIAKDKIVEVWQHWDRLGMLEQVGEISLRLKPVAPGYYSELLKSMGLEKYVESAPQLTVRERQCLKCLLDGHSAKETAVIYKLSPRTVEYYFENIKRKLKCPTKRDLFTVAQTLDKLDLL